MDIEEIKKFVFDYVVSEYIDEEEAEITYETPLISSGYVDSFSMVSLLVYLERKFNIKIPPAKATPEVFNTVSRIAELVVQSLK